MWTASNLMSIFRMVLAFPMAVLILNGHFISSIIIGILAVATDLMDGYLARKLNQITEMGKIVDPLADKIFVGTVAVCLVIIGRMPLWFVIAVVMRDAAILAGGLYAKGKIDFVIPSNYVGKITALILSAIMGGALFNISWFWEYGVYIGLGGLIISLSIYAKQMLDKIKESSKTGNEIIKGE